MARPTWTLLEDARDADRDCDGGTRIATEIEANLKTAVGVDLFRWLKGEME